MAFFVNGKLLSRCDLDRPVLCKTLQAGMDTVVEWSSELYMDVSVGKAMYASFGAKGKDHLSPCVCPAVYGRKLAPPRP